MIARKIVYQGKFDSDTIGAVYDITRKVEITGEVVSKGENELVLNLEGDASMIKLIQHKIERKVKEKISHKTVEPIAFQSYQGIRLVYT